VEDSIRLVFGKQSMGIRQLVPHLDAAIHQSVLVKPGAWIRIAHHGHHLAPPLKQGVNAGSSQQTGSPGDKHDFGQNPLLVGVWGAYWGRA
jgi:hypothetical protein